MRNLLFIDIAKYLILAIFTNALMNTITILTKKAHRYIICIRYLLSLDTMLYMILWQLDLHQKGIVIPRMEKEILLSSFRSQTSFLVRLFYIDKQTKDVSIICTKYLLQILVLNPTEFKKRRFPVYVARLQIHQLEFFHFRNQNA